MGSECQLESAPTCGVVTFKLNVNDGHVVVYQPWTLVEDAVGTWDDRETQDKNCALIL